MEFFRSVNVDWLGKKWYFLGFSLIFSVAGIISMASHWAHIGSPVPLGVDFRGGTQVQVQFDQTPDIEPDSPGDGSRRASRMPSIQSYGVSRHSNEVLISLPEQTNETALDAGPRADRERAAGALQQPLYKRA